MEDLNNIDEGNIAEDGTQKFRALGLEGKALEAVKIKGFTEPTPIQLLAIPKLLEGNANIIARARTGTGKTAAFGLPLVQKIDNKDYEVRALILEPTRELGIQTAREMESFSGKNGTKVALVYGGASMLEQIQAIRAGAQIVVGTPGRIKDHLERKTLNLSNIKYFILDEADEMLDMGFIEDIEDIFLQAAKDCRVLLFSATMPKPILKIARKFMGDYEIIEEAYKEEKPLPIEQKYWTVRENQKIEALVRLIDFSKDFYALVFTRMKSSADDVARLLEERGYAVEALHGDISQSLREKVLQRFRSKRTKILVATDVAARGIDIEGVTHVINYDLPENFEIYTHRIGRTGRAGASGLAITFVTPRERKAIEYIKKSVMSVPGANLIEEQIPTIEEVLEAKRNRLFQNMRQQLFIKDTSPVQNQKEGGTNVETEETIVTKTAALATVGKLRQSKIFDAMADDLCAGQDAKSVLSAVLAVTYGNALKKENYGNIENVSNDTQRDNWRDTKGKVYHTQKGKLRIYVHLGKNDLNTPKDLAYFFAQLLHISQNDVRDIDMAKEFSLVTLNEKDARTALDLSRNDRSLPGMHIDNKSSTNSSQGTKQDNKKLYTVSYKKNGTHFDNVIFDYDSGFSRKGNKDFDFKKSKKHGESKYEKRFEDKLKKDYRTPTNRNASSSYKKSDPNEY